MSRILLLSLVAIAATLVPSPARAKASTTVTCKDGTTATAGRGACSRHGGVDKTAASEPTPAAEPSGKRSHAGPTDNPEASVTCKDGTVWAKAGRGACSGHGGVAKTGEAPIPPTPPAHVAAKAAPEAAPSYTPPMKSGAAPRQVAPTATATGKRASADPAGALARCKDGLYWHGVHHQGACSRHGGVAEWMPGPT